MPDIVSDHTLSVCRNPECRGCQFCEGGLMGCSVCHCLEGCWTTDCPRRALTTTQSDLIYAGKLDYRAGQWVERPSRISTIMSMFNIITPEEFNDLLKTNRYYRTCSRISGLPVAMWLEEKAA